MCSTRSKLVLLGASWFYCRIQLLVLSQRWVFTAQLARDTRVPFPANTSNTQLAPLNTFFSQRAHSVVRTHSSADMHETRMFRVFVNTQHALLDTFFSTRAHSVGRTHSLECEWKNARTRGMSRHQLHSYSSYSSYTHASDPRHGNPRPSLP